MVNLRDIPGIAEEEEGPAPKSDSNSHLQRLSVPLCTGTTLENNENITLIQTYVEQECEELSIPCGEHF